MDKKYMVLPNHTSTFKSGKYKYLIVSKTNDKDAVEIILGDKDGRHAAILQAYMNDNDLKTVFCWGGGSVNIWCDSRWYLCFYGTSGDFDSTKKEMLEIIRRKSRDERRFIYDDYVFYNKEQAVARELDLKRVSSMLR